MSRILITGGTGNIGVRLVADMIADAIMCSSQLVPKLEVKVS